jgi:hypothetical protein
MKYVLLICTPVGGAELSPAEIAEDPRFTSYIEEVRSRDIVKGGARLRPASDATTVRVQGDEVLLTDGPFIEGREQVGGLAIVDCADLDEAIEIAAGHPAAAMGQIEIRPLR